VNPTYGWFVGFAGLLYMAVGGGAIMLEVASPLLLSEFNVNKPEPAPGAHGGDHLDAAAGGDQHHQHPGRGAGSNNVAVFTEIIGTVVFGVLLFRAVGRARQALAVRRRHPVSTPRPFSHNATLVRLRAGQPARHLHPGRVRARRRHVRGRGQPGAQRAARACCGGSASPWFWA